MTFLSGGSYLLRSFHLKLENFDEIVEGTQICYRSPLTVCLGTRNSYKKRLGDDLSSTRSIAPHSKNCFCINWFLVWLVEPNKIKGVFDRGGFFPKIDAVAIFDDTI